MIPARSMAALTIRPAPRCVRRKRNLVCPVNGYVRQGLLDAMLQDALRGLFR